MTASAPPADMARMNSRFGQLRTAFALALLAVLATAGPAQAHKDHRAKMAAEQAAAAASPGAAMPMDHASPMENHAATAQAAEPDDPPKTFAARLIDWLGRLHPMLVHFPIAFIPAALFTAVVGRRRPSFAVPVQFLVLTAAVTAPFALASGWLSGGFSLANDDWLLQTHRWLGTGVALGSMALGLFAFRRLGDDRNNAMVAGLGVLTLAIAIQGWLGGALVHGVDHLDW